MVSCVPVSHLNGSAPSECMMAVCVRSVAASLYILLHTGQGRGSWNASFLVPNSDLLSGGLPSVMRERVSGVLSWSGWYLRIACSATCFSFAAADRRLASWLEQLGNAPTAPGSLSPRSFPRASSCPRSVPMYAMSGVKLSGHFCSLPGSLASMGSMWGLLRGSWVRIDCSIGTPPNFSFFVGSSSVGDTDLL